jgi:D-xylose transport system substrate-binding protein
VRTARAAGTALILAACTSYGGSPSPVSAGGSGISPSPEFSLSQINNSLSAMSVLKPLAAEGKGSIAVLLPDTHTASFFRETAKPDFQDSFQRAGLGDSQYTIKLSPGAGQLGLAKTAIAQGASVLIVDARSSGEGISIESYAQAHHVKVIDYDFLTVGGTRDYYIGFDSLKIGVLLGQGLVSCVAAWGVKHPQVIVMQGGAGDYNSALYAQGYDAILAREFSHDGWKDISNPAGTWDPPTAESEFQQQYTAHKNINAALIPNDENGAPIIGYLKSNRIKARTFPTTGLDATLLGLQNILAGYQCGTVYKPISLEVQATAALALYLRAGVTPPGSLLNGSITDPQSNASVPAVLLTPVWVTTENMNSTVIADKFYPAAKLCAGYAAACATAGISG